MILALDIETVRNPDTFEFLPDPKATSRTSSEEKKAKQIEKAACDPLTGRVCCYAMVGITSDGQRQETTRCIDANDETETELVSEIMDVLGRDDTRIVTFNGAWFDVPFLYTRAMILGINLPLLGVPPLPAWTKRYSTDRHYDLGNIWYGWGQRKEGENMERLASLILHDHKTALDVTTFAELMKVQEGRDKIAAYCLQDTRLTWRLFEKMQGVLFA
jgi:DNA polymerase elongation subunit (family B)